MVTLDFLKGLKEFLQTEVANKIQLQKEETNPIEYVNPYVEICYLPHKNFAPYDFQVPLLLITLDDGSDGADKHELSIRLILATYGGGFYEDTKIPDAKGYIDLINFIEFTRQALINKSVINELGTVQRPVNYGIYDTELIYPYWYGYITFTASIQSTECLLNF
ncbi:hypothetical protein EHE19_001575 [Ruminiclostridium herbifermentans]|uniref:Uncharacterized protein n=1 Tax=Ruminiclostridium herbifermentans TaxID=2488810 RepID=A0A4U7J6Z9_9FIRM|nr:hypothetical protein [Ruminiclostridium herbifermentans]QNU67261.1 hypothetical protein EHE19_001575 [Ruminiclostridium herbifermentans]